MNKLVEIKQQANSFAKSWNKDKDITAHPNSFRFYTPKKNDAGEWVTGLSELEQEELGKKIKKDLSPLSNYWRDLNILLVNRMQPVTFNLSITEQYIQYKCALGNKFIAENKERLSDSDYKINDCFLYVFDPKGDVERENLMQEVKDEVTSMLYEMRSNKTKMLHFCAKLNISFNDNYSAGEFWKMLRGYLDKQKTLPHLQTFKELLSIPNEVLYVEYIVNKNMGTGKTIKKIDSQWVYSTKLLGDTKAKVINYFLKHEDMFALLIEEND